MMRELMRTNNPVQLSFIKALLAEAGVAFEVFDTHMSITEGNAYFIAPRVMVDADDLERAQRLVREAGIDAR